MNDRRSGSDDGGYILVALLVSIAIAAVWMAAALPSWRQQVIREREAELIFRGEQYARAIRLYQQQMGGTLPSSLDDLVSQHLLRRKWKDPITGDEFLPKVGCLQLGPGGGIPGGGIPGGGIPGGGIPGGGIPGRGVPGGGTGGRPGGIPSPVGRTGAPINQGGAITPQNRGGIVQPQIPSQPGRGGQLPGGFGQQGQGGICGVQSKSKEASIKIYNGQQQYDLWQFDTTTAALQFQRNMVRLGGAAAGVPAMPVGMPGITQPGGGNRRGGAPDPRGLRGPSPFGPSGPGGGTPGRGVQPGTPPSFPPGGRR